MSVLIPGNSIFLAIIAASVVLAVTILVIPAPLFLAASNGLQIIAALAGAIVLFLFRRRSSQPRVYLLAGAGLAIWGIANIAWYADVLMGMRGQVFPSLIDAGMLCAFLVLSLALWTGLPGKKPVPVISLVIIVLCLLAPVGLILVTGFSIPTLVTFFYFAVCGLLIAGGVAWYPERCLAGPGVVFVALAFMIYPLREMYIVTNPALPMIGTFVSTGFSILVICLLQDAGKADTP
jgi:hypothetical protein